MGELQEWVKKHEDDVRKHAPPGWTYRGDYAYVLGFGRYGHANIWECSTYGDFDVWREHDDETWIRLVGEYVDFFPPEAGEAVLLRELGDTRIFEPEK